jgi:hypothetical protein
LFIIFFIYIYIKVFLKKYDFSNFSLFYFIEDHFYERINVGDGIYLSVAKFSCMRAPTVCLVGGTGELKGKKYLGYNFYLIK